VSRPYLRGNLDRRHLEEEEEEEEENEQEYRDGRTNTRKTFSAE